MRVHCSRCKLWLVYPFWLVAVTCGWVQTTCAQSPTPDSFNPDPGTNGYILTLAVQPDGKILAGGYFTTLGGQPRNCLARLNADGTLDQNFNPNAQSYSDVSSLTVQVDGKILVGGNFTKLGGQTRNRIGRLNADGSLDASFNPGADNRVSSLVIQADGKILVAGIFKTLGGKPRSGIGRLNADGSLDNNFDPRAYLNSYGTAFVAALAVQADGKIVVSGNFDTMAGQPRNYIARIDEQGNLDPDFVPNGYGYSSALVVQPDGKILASGSFTTLSGQTGQGIARLNTDGSFDDGFKANASADMGAFSMTLQADGKILVGGFFTKVHGQVRQGIARLNPDGTLDDSFNPGAWLDNFDHPSVKSLVIQTDGKILVGGQFSILGGQARHSIGRLNNTDAVTETFCYEGTTISWFRGGTAPEVWRTTFEYSTDGTLWTMLGEGTRIPGGWQVTGVSVTPGTIRARGYTTCGYSNGSGGIVETTLSVPIITAQPVGVITKTATTVTFNVGVTGSLPLTYQWRRNSENLANGGTIAGVGTATLILAGVSGDDAGGYDAVVTNTYGSATSTMATLTVDEVAPTATIVYSSTTPTNTDVTATLQPSETVTVTNNSGALTYVFAANGEFTFEFRDAAGNTGTAKATVTNIDKVPPTVTVNQAVTQVDPTGSSPILYTVVFSKPVADFATGDVILSGTAGAMTASVTEIAPNNGTTYQVTVSGMTKNGTIIAAIAANVAHDAAGNPNVASTNTDNTVTYDTTPPTAAVTYGLDRPTRQGETQEITVVFSEPMADTPVVKLAMVYTGDIPTLAATAMTKVDSTHYTYNLAVPAGNGTGTVSLVAGTDVAGNPVTAEPTSGATFVVDNLAPTATIAYSITGPINTDVTAILQPSEAVTVTNNSGALTHVFAANGELTFEFEDAAGNTGTAKATVANIDKVAPIGTIAYSTTTTTNTDVTATLQPNEAVTVTNNNGSLTYVFSANGEFTFEFQDAAGNTGTAKAAVANIDKIAPTATIAYSTTAPTNTDVTATLQPNEAVTVTNNNGSLTNVFSANGEFTFEFQDAAGNTGTAKATVSNIDKAVPTATIAYSATDPTNADVTATLQPSEAVTVTNNSGALTHLFAANGEFTFEFRDAAGNTGTAKATVARIDKVAPTASLSGTPAAQTQVTAADITVGDADVTLYRFKLDAGAWGGATPVAEHIALTNLADGAHTLAVIGRDAAGNWQTEAAATPAVWTVDTLAPTATIAYSATTPTNANVTATLQPSEAVTVTNNSGALTHVFAANGEFTFEFQDAAGNKGTAKAVVANIDKVAPTVTINQTATQVDPTGSSPILYTVVFSEPVADFATGDVSLSGTAGAAKATVAQIAPNDGTTYRVAVNGMVGSGTVFAAIAAGAAHDAAGNPNVASTSSDNQVEYTIPGNVSGAHSTVGYLPGVLCTVSCTITFSGTTPSALGWAVTIPTGWTYAGGNSEPGAKPSVGDQGTLEWTWSAVGTSPIQFAYSLNVPLGETGDRQIPAAVKVRYDDGPIQYAVTPDPLAIHPGLYHSADTGVVSVPPQSNWRIDQDELMRVIQLYNYRAGTTRTGEYHVLVATEDGYDLGPGEHTGKPSHSADTGVVDLPALPNWKVNQDELMRVIQLYNYRSGTTRTGDYHVQASTEDGYAPGPAARSADGGTVDVAATRGTVGTHSGPADYPSAGGQVTIACQLTYDGTPTSLGWAATIPDGWAYAGGTNEPGTKPQTGDTGAIEWTWSSIPASPITFSYTLTVPAGQTGDKPVTALSKVRYGGGPTATAVTPNPLVIREKDTTAPSLTVVHLQSNGANSAVAHIRDTLTLSFTANETIKTPTVTIAGHALSATQARAANDWSATYAMAAVDAEGPAAFRIEFADLAGNPGVAVTQTSDGSGVTFMKDWLLTISVTNADKASVQFGMHPDAKDTNLVDPMDEGCPPPPNPPNAKGGLFFLGLVDDIVVSLGKDVRKTKAVERWNLEAVAHSNAMVLSWDKTTVPPDRSLFLWEVNAQGQLVTGTRYNMATTANLDVPANTVKHLVLYGGPVGFPLVLEAGWNMISLPIEPTNPAVTDVFAASRGGDVPRQETFTDYTRGGTLHTGEIWMWVPTGSGHYETVTELHALKAYWVYVQNPVTVVVPGTTPGTCIASLPKGWNSLGPAKAKPAPYANPDIWDRVWRWNTVTTQYEAVDEAGLMQPGCGYWIMPRKAISLDLGE